MIPKVIAEHLSAGWYATGLLIISFATLLTFASSRFGYETEVIDMPVLALTVGLVAWGAIFLGLMAWLLKDWLLKDWLLKGVDGNGRLFPAHLLWFVFAVGLAARLVLLISQPILEDDYQRYLWDGAVVAEGLNPYLRSPEEIRTSITDGPLQALKEQAGLVFKRINHKDLTTIYPPLAQAAFVLASTIAPFSLTAWRGVLLLADIVTFALLLQCLDALGRSRAWTALYWWNPVLLKEITNSAHFDVLIFPFMLAALLFAFRRRAVAASTMLGLAAGIKLWPVLLLPLILRSATNERRTLLMAAGVFVGLMGLWLAPIISAGLGEGAGLAAYAASWSKNGPGFAIVHGIVARLADAFGILGDGAANLTARAILAATAGSVALAAAWRPITGFGDLAARALVIVAVLIFCSPAVYPWYTLWLLPLLVLRPEPGLLLLSATIPVYYTYFYFAARETAEIFHSYVTWLIWLPVFALLGWRMLRNGERGKSMQALGSGG